MIYHSIGLRFVHKTHPKTWTGQRVSRSCPDPDKAWRFCEGASPLRGAGDTFNDAVQAKFALDALLVAVHGVEADVKGGGNLGVAVAGEVSNILR